jgi:hypothetical protein
MLENSKTAPRMVMGPSHILMAQNIQENSKTGNIMARANTPSLMMNDI